ncbi:MAG: hypothetical protein DRJ03_26150 [Chloroflexi bacterium]|nr:MAG: hypothetical protein DRJ03_26150 [Chloroflexota bacterium]
MDKETILWQNGFQVKFHGTHVYIWRPIYGEDATLSADWGIEDLEEWLDDNEIRQARANALERAIFSQIPFDIAYEEEVGEICYEKIKQEIDERVEAWDSTKTVHRVIKGFDVYLCTFVDEMDGYVTYYVEMEIPEELYDQMDANAIMDLFDEMLEEMDYPDLGIAEFI